MRGRFITLEGGEGAGKTTQRARLVNALQTRFRIAGQPVQALATREPGGSPGAETIRSLLVCGPGERWDDRTEALLHTAARRDHVLRTIEPALAAGIWVVCDRFVDSTLAYQGWGHGLDTGDLRALHQFACNGLMPDLTLLLDLPIRDGLARTRTREQGDQAAQRPETGQPGGQGRETASPSARENRYEQMDLTFHERVRDGFLAIARSDPDRVRIEDARCGEDELLCRLLGHVRAAFPELEEGEPGS
ncbi:dTMP kinase [Phaeovibrio sulfidiphilus]|nr:dTMP kinase [Phaeovibrio sulfidiphilus]